MQWFAAFWLIMTISIAHAEFQLEPLPDSRVVQFYVEAHRAIQAPCVDSAIYVSSVDERATIITIDSELLTVRRTAISLAPIQPMPRCVWLAGAAPSTVYCVSDGIIGTLDLDRGKIDPVKPMQDVPITISSLAVLGDRLFVQQGLSTTIIDISSGVVVQPSVILPGADRPQGARGALLADPQRRRLLYVVLEPDSTFLKVFALNATLQWSLLPAASPPVAEIGNGAYLQAVLARDRLLWASRGTLHQLNLTTLAWSNVTISGSAPQLSKTIIGRASPIASVCQRRDGSERLVLFADSALGTYDPFPLLPVAVDFAAGSGAASWARASGTVAPSPQMPNYQAVRAGPLLLLTDNGASRFFGYDSRTLGEWVPLNATGVPAERWYGVGLVEFNDTHVLGGYSHLNGVSVVLIHAETARYPRPSVRGLGQSLTNLRALQDDPAWQD